MNQNQARKRKYKKYKQSRWRFWLRSIGIGLLTISVAGASQTTSQLARAEIPPHLGYGINVRLEENIDSFVPPLGFGWIKLWEEYEDEPPAERLPYQILFTINCKDGMPANLDDWGDHIENIAQAGKGFVEAYEICNEPNVERFWGGKMPDPREYIQLLRIASERIKAVDPSAFIISAGLAPVGRIQGGCGGLSGNNCHAMDEREYARQMFLLGAGDYFDAFGYHPYGFAYAPETDPHQVSNGFAFRGAEVMHDLMEQYGLGPKSIWATEFNWLREWDNPPSDCRSDYKAVFGWMEVSEEEQADYIERAFQYADENWPWMGAMFVWDLDWHNYHPWDCEASRYFSILRADLTAQGLTRPPSEEGTQLRVAPDGMWYKVSTTHTLSYDALAEMEKRPGHFGPKLALSPDSLTFWADVNQPGIYTTTLRPWNAGYRVMTWTATAATGLQVTPTLAITTALQGVPLTVTVNTTGYITGSFTGNITVTATATKVLNAPQVVPVRLFVQKLHYTYLPITFRSAP